MFWAMRGYQRISHEDGHKLPPTSPSNNILRFPLQTCLVFAAGVLSCFIATVPFLINTLPQHERRVPPVIPPEVFAPKIPTAWVPDERYIGFSGYANLRWHQLVQTTESVWIPDPSEHALGEGFEASFNHTLKSEQPPRFYHISNLHQLHCLNIIRGRYFELYYNTSSLSKQSETAAADTKYHVEHCIEYLRMSIMCGGSWDIESNSPPGTPRELKIDPFGHPIGWGGIRNCINWDTLITWQKKQLDKYKETWTD